MKAAINIGIVAATALLVWWAMSRAYEMGEAAGYANRDAQHERVTEQMRNFGICQYALMLAARNQCPRAETGEDHDR